MKILLPRDLHVPSVDFGGSGIARVWTDLGLVPARATRTDTSPDDLVKLELLSGTVLLLPRGTECQLDSGVWQLAEALACGPCKPFEPAKVVTRSYGAAWAEGVEPERIPPGAALLRSWGGQIVEVVRRLEIVETKLPMWFIEFAGSALAIGRNPDVGGVMVRSRE